MLIASIQVAQLAGGKVRVSWTGGALLNVWLFCNGSLVFEDLDFAGETERELDVAVDTRRPFLIEVHEAAAASAISAIFPHPELTPFVHWAPSAGAEQYRVYHKESGGAEGCLRVVFHDEHQDHYAVSPYNALEGRDGVWHAFRVEARDYYRRETTTTRWWEMFYDFPTSPAGLAVAGSGGVFSLTVTF